MIALPPNCLPPQLPTMELICSSRREQVDDSIHISDTIFMYSMTSPITALKNRVSEISMLTDGWDGYGAVIPSNDVINNAFRFLDSIISNGFEGLLKSDDIIPTPYGTIGMDFESEVGLVSVEIGRTQLGFFTQYNTGQNIISEGIQTNFKTLPDELVTAISVILENEYANAFDS